MHNLQDFLQNQASVRKSSEFAAEWRVPHGDGNSRQWSNTNRKYVVLNHWRKSPSPWNARHPAASSDDPPTGFLVETGISKKIIWKSFDAKRFPIYGVLHIPPVPKRLPARFHRGTTQHIPRSCEQRPSDPRLQSWGSNNFGEWGHQRGSHFTESKVLEHRCTFYWSTWALLDFNVFS